MIFDISKEAHLAYIAGFLDGEGCFHYNKWAGGNSITVTCSNTYKPIIQALQNCFGGTVRKDKKDKSHHKQCFTWCVVGNKAFELCGLLAPYLDQKQKQALLIMLIQGSKTKGGKQIPVALKEERMRLGDLLQKTKHETWE